MNDAVQFIIDILHQLAGLHRQLVTLGIEKQNAVLGNKAEAVAMITSRETRLIQSIAEMDKQRILAVGQYVARLGIMPTGTFRMEQLIQMVYKAEEKQKLRSACEELSGVLRELKEINDFNQQMLRLNLEFISHWIDIIAGPGEEEATYHRSLQSDGFKRYSLFDTRA